jgi:hypothetical protein
LAGVHDEDTVIARVPHCVAVRICLSGVVRQAAVIAGVGNAVAIAVESGSVFIDLTVAIIVDGVADLSAPWMNHGVGIVAVTLALGEGVAVVVALIGAAQRGPTLMRAVVVQPVCTELESSPKLVETLHGS